MEKLKLLYFDINEPLSFGSLNQTYELNRKYKLGLTKDQIRKFHKDNVVNQVFKQPRQKSSYSKIQCPPKSYCLQVDIMDLQRFERKNKGFKYLLNVIDVYSRYVFSYPIKSKSDKVVITKLKPLITMLENKNDYRITVMMDDGSEFNLFKKLLKSKNIDYWIAKDADRTKYRNSLVERWHRSYWEILKKVLLVNDTLNWVQYHDKIINKYNNTVHSFTRMTPNDIFNNDKLSNNKPYFVKKSTPTLQIGDTVRILRNKEPFEKKSFTPNYSIELFTIDSRRGKRYILRDSDGDLVKGEYLQRQLQRVDKDTIDQSIGKTFTKEEFQNRLDNVRKRLNQRSGLDIDPSTGNVMYLEHRFNKPKNKKRQSRAPNRLNL